MTLLPTGGRTAGSDGYRFITAMPQPRSPATGPAGLTAELVYAGYGRDIDLAGKDLHGKGVVVRGRPLQGGHTTARGLPDELARLGAAFVIVIFDVPMNVQIYNGGLVGTLVPATEVTSCHSFHGNGAHGRPAGSRPRMRRARSAPAGAAVSERV